MNLSDLETKLAAYGLHLRGLLKVTDEEVSAQRLDIVPGASLALVGNAGASYWPEFERSPEFSDGLVHPLDRWSRRIGDQLATELRATAIYPFEGPPYYPFQQWAGRAESLQQSVLGLMIHPRFGLWHSYRFGLLLPDVEAASIDAGNAGYNPCTDCQARPCLKTCPVGAYDADNYDVDQCTAFLKDSPEAPCHTEGCLSRLACPVGSDYRYSPAQHTFHLRAFLATR